MNPTLAFLRKAWLPLACLSLVLFACNVNETKDQQVFSFPTLVDSLKGYDSAVIVIQDLSGKTLDTLYHGPVNPSTNLTGLSAPHYSGGTVKVVIEGLNKGVVVYQIERGYDGTTAQPAVPIIIPSALLSLEDITLNLKLGDSRPLPNLQLSPANLSTREIHWSSSDPSVLQVDQSTLKALKIGTAWLRAQLGADAAKSDSIKVVVSARDSVVEPLIDSLRLSPDTLQVSVGGAAQKFQVTFYPANAPSEIVYGSLDTTVATISPAGLVRGIKSAFTRVFARSLAVAGVNDTAWVRVLPKVEVDSIRFKSRQLELFQQGASETLYVQAYPALASQEFEFLLRNVAIAKVASGKVQGLLEGDTWIVAKSADNPAKMDSVHVLVLPATQVESVTVKPDTLKLYLKGESLPLKANIYPSTLKSRFLWHSSAPGIAEVDTSGKVSPIAVGYAFVSAISRADSTKRDSSLVLVKKDTPKLAVGPDTILSVGLSVKFSPVAPQEYGLVTAFKWDLNGDGVYEDSAATLKEVSYYYGTAGDFPAKFYVRDTEGNDTVVTRHIKAVTGLIVQITSPKDGFTTNTAGLDVVWSVDNASHTDKETLVEGVNTVTRTAKDVAGNTFTASIKVTLDTKPPKAPTVKGPTGPVSSHNPTWTWSSGGEGSGAYRMRLDAADMSQAKAIADTFFTADSSLGEGTHTLYIQEKDVAGNWSASGSFAVAIDVTPPKAPTVLVNTPAVTNVVKPVWNWTGNPDGAATFQYKVDDANFNGGATETTALTYTPPANLAAGVHTVYVRERDAAGNWSLPGNAQVTIDLTAPTAPKVTGSSPTSLSPKWTWTSGGGGSGDYRFHLGADPTATDIETKNLEFTQTTPVSGTTYTLYVQERDAAGNWSSSGTLPITYDLTKPTVTITAPQASGTYLTRSATVDVSGSSSSPSGPNAIKTVVYSVDGVAGNISTNLGATGGWSIKALPLSNNKTIVLKVTATDVAGNSGEASLSILMDNTAPTPPAFAAQPPAIVNKTDSRTSLQWTWNRTGDATDSFVVKLNTVEVSRQTAAAYTINNPTDGDYQIEVVEKDLAGNTSTTLTSVKVLLDRTSPTAPDLTKPASPKKTAQWTWTPGGGGNGSFQCQLNGGATAACTSPYNLPTPTDGDYSLSVRELDAAGNFSAWSTTSVTIDLQIPLITLGNYKNTPDQIINTVKAFSGTASDERGLRFVKYHEDSDADNIASGTTSWSFTPALKTGTHTLTIYAEDLAGNQATTTVSITYEPDVIFVRKGATGSGDGSSWTNAYSELSQLLVGGKNYSTDKQIWVSKGTYTPSSDWGFTIGSNSFVYGGFASDGTNRSLSERDLVNNQSILNKYPGATSTGIKVISNTSLSGDGTTVISSTNVGLSDFSIGSSDYGILIQGTPKATLSGISMKYQTFSVNAVNVYDANVDIKNSHFIQNSAVEGVINVIPGSGAKRHARFQNVEIYANTSSDGGGVVLNDDACAGGSSSFTENTNNEVQVYGGSFSRENSVTIGGNGISDGSNTIVGSCPAPF